VEWFREPDTQLGFILGPFTMGQTLSSFMIVGGILLLSYLKRKKEKIDIGRKKGPFAPPGKRPLA
jgi:phosphatidylglycerol:prolipoprotein diacylglycerol transferase